MRNVERKQMKSWNMNTHFTHTLALGACLLAATAVGQDWKPANGPLMTRWAEDVNPMNAHREYPRPQLVRKDWLNLNGLWNVEVKPRTSGAPESYTEQILVPFPIESALSGLLKRVTEKDRIWYHRLFDLPPSWQGRRVLLNFGAVDFEAIVFVNGRKIGEHRGGYTGFSFDITDALNKKAPNELVVAVWDPTDAGTQPRGKQIRNPHGIWYTPSSGIWQTVWLEPVSAAHISSLTIVPNVDEKTVSIKATTTPTLGRHSLEITVRNQQGTVVAEGSVAPGGTIQIPIKEPRLWSPESPYLYDLTVKLNLGSKTVDRVESYFGMRKISLGKDTNGFTRLMLNNQPYFQLGPLDQGFWPDGLYTAPTDEALRYDIEITRKLGFNMARKHVKIEPPRWYYWADKLGLIVWQDMPSGDKYIGSEAPDITRSPESAAQFEQELTGMIDTLRNHPSIVMWVPYNEGWGQWDTARITELVKKLDPTRLVNNASGWTDRKVGDVNDIHRYPGPAAPDPEPNRAAVLGEFGGLGYPIAGHTWQSEKNWGYRNYTNVESLEFAYATVLSKVFPLIHSHGLSAAVYTQTTDVEVEVNGLLTYDRALVKMGLERTAAINLGRVRPPPKTVEVVPTSRRERQQWRYTTDQPGDGWFGPEFNDSNWKSSPGGFGSEGTRGAVIGTVWATKDIWLRREFKVSDANDAEWQLLMHHDEDVEVFINGVIAATASGFETDYQAIPMNLSAATSIKPGRNVIAVHCRNSTGGQFIDVGLVQVIRERQ